MTTTETAICGETTDTAIGLKTCNRPPHTDDLHSDGDETGGTSWRHHPAAGSLDEELLAGMPHLLWSNRGELWWRPDGAGYTTDVWQAGRYTRVKAVAEARCDDFEDPPAIVAVLAPEAGVDCFTPAELAGVGELMRRRVAEATAAVVAARGGAR